MNNERYLDPPDEPEAELCEDCGQEMVENPANYKASMPDFRCVNPYCPAKFEDLVGNGAVLGMAQKLVEVTETLKSTQSTLKYVRTKLSHYEDVISAREDSIALLERTITEYEQILTLGQDK